VSLPVRVGSESRGVNVENGSDSCYGRSHALTDRRRSTHYRQLAPLVLSRMWWIGSNAVDGALALGRIPDHDASHSRRLVRAGFPEPSPPTSATNASEAIALSPPPSGCPVADVRSNSLVHGRSIRPSVTGVSVS